MSFEIQEIVQTNEPIRENEEKLKALVKQYFENNRQLSVEVSKRCMKDQSTKIFKTRVQLDNVAVDVLFETYQDYKGQKGYDKCIQYEISCEELEVIGLQVSTKNEEAIRGELQVKFYSNIADGTVQFYKTILMKN